MLSTDIDKAHNCNYQLLLIFSYKKYKKFMFNLMHIIKVNIIMKVVF